MIFVDDVIFLFNSQLVDKSIDYIFQVIFNNNLNQFLCGFNIIMLPILLKKISRSYPRRQCNVFNTCIWNIYIY